MYRILQAPFDGSVEVPGCRMGSSKIVDYALSADYGLEQHMINYCSIINHSEKLSLNNIETKFSELCINSNTKILTLGGNHIITYPILESLRKNNRKISLIYFDAHSDTDYCIVPTNSSFISYFKKQAPDTIISNVGLRFKEHTMSQEIYHIPSSNFLTNSLSSISDELVSRHKNTEVYISIDLDVLDPCYAPGVSSPIGGGISTMQLNLVLIELLNKLNIIGIDLTEYNPFKENNNITLSSIISILWQIHKVWSN